MHILDRQCKAFATLQIVMVNNWKSISTTLKNMNITNRRHLMKEPKGFDFVKNKLHVMFLGQLIILLAI